MIIENVLDLIQNQTFFALERFSGKMDVFLKLEGLNLAGSIKIKTALRMLKGLEDRNEASPGRNRIIESSSGNLGIALSMICKERGYEFCCVVDPNISPRSLELIRLYGGHIELVTRPDANGGYLQSRIQRIRELLAADPTLVWTNQYANQDNVLAHYETTAVEIHSQFPKLDFLFIGAGTTGTLVGCARYFAEKSPLTKIVAVDPEGSVTFGKPSQRRLIPGLGTSRRPEITSLHNVHQVITVSEVDTIRTCREVLERYRLFIGPSTGTVLHGVRSYPSSFQNNETIVVISPDFGDKYLDTVYNPDWVQKHYDMTGSADAACAISRSGPA